MSVIGYLHEVSLTRKMPATSVQSSSPQTCKPSKMEEHPSGNKEQAASVLGQGLWPGVFLQEAILTPLLLRNVSVNYSAAFRSYGDLIFWKLRKAICFPSSAQRVWSEQFQQDSTMHWGGTRGTEVTKPPPHPTARAVYQLLGLLLCT